MAKRNCDVIILVLLNVLCKKNCEMDLGYIYENQDHQVEVKMLCNQCMALRQ